MNKRHCLIINNGRYSNRLAYSSEGRLITTSQKNEMFSSFVEHLGRLGYETLPWNSRLARTILDKVQMQQF